MADDERNEWRVGAPEPAGSDQPEAATAPDAPLPAADGATETAPATEAETAAETAAATAAPGPVDPVVEALLRQPEVGARAAPGGPAGAPVETHRRRNRRPLVITAGLIAVAVVVATALLVDRAGTGNATVPDESRLDSGVAAVTSAPPTAASPSPSLATPAVTPPPTPNLSPDAGVVVFEDDFKTSSKGWATGTPTTLTTLSLTPAGYVIAASGASTDHLIAAPPEQGYQALAVTAVGSQASGRGSAGFGVTCQAAGALPRSAATATGSSATKKPASSGGNVVYEFVVINSGSWLVERRDVSQESAPPVVLMHGTTTTTPGSTSISVTGMCATSWDGQRVRLAMFINGLPITEVGDFTDDPVLWKGGVVVTTGDVPATVTIHDFEERDLD